MWRGLELGFSKASYLGVFTFFTSSRSSSGCLCNFLRRFIQHIDLLIWFFSSSIAENRLIINTAVHRALFSSKVLPAICKLLPPASRRHPSAYEVLLLLIIGLLSQGLKLIINVPLFFILNLIILLICLQITHSCIQWSSITFIEVIDWIFINILELSLTYGSTLFKLWYELLVVAHFIAYSALSFPFQEFTFHLFYFIFQKFGGVCRVMANRIVVEDFFLFHSTYWLAWVVNNNCGFIAAFGAGWWTVPWHPTILAHEHIIFQLDSWISFAASFSFRHLCLVEERCFVAVIDVYFLGAALLILIRDLILVTDSIKHAWEVIHLLTWIIFIWIYRFRLSIRLLPERQLLIPFSIALFFILVIHLPFEPNLIILFSYLVNFLLCIEH